MTFENNCLDSQDFRISYFNQSLIKVLDVFDLCRLSDSKTLCSLESFQCVKVQSLFGLLKDTSKQEKTAYNSASPALPMIAMKHRNPVWVLLHESAHLFTDIEEEVKGG